MLDAYVKRLVRDVARGKDRAAPRWIFARYTPPVLPRVLALTLLSGCALLSPLKTMPLPEGAREILNLSYDPDGAIQDPLHRLSIYARATIPIGSNVR